MEQDVYISLHTYHDLQYLGDCYGTFQESEVYISSEEHDDLWQANPSGAHLPMIKMQGGAPLEVQVWTLFDVDDLMPHDWQLVVLASRELVDIAIVAREAESANAGLTDELDLASTVKMAALEESGGREHMSHQKTAAYTAGAFFLTCVFIWCVRICRLPRSE